MRFRREPSRFPVILILAVIGLAAGLALAAFFSLPRVTSVSPAAGAQGVSSRAPIRLTFTRPMDHASVEAALRVSPEIAGAFVWEEAAVTFAPNTPWPAEGAVTATLAGGKSQRGLPLLGQSAWTFTVGGPRVAYLAGEVPNLWVLALAESAAPRQVTAELTGVYDFDVSPDGTQFVYAALRADGGADLRVINVDGTGAADLLACPGEACLSPAFSPDGQWLAYERHALDSGLAGEVTIGSSHVHLFSPAAKTDALLGEAQNETRFPRWGPDGRLSYFDDARQALVIHDLAAEAVTYIPDSSGEMGTWSPDGQFIVFPEIFLSAEPTSAPAANGATPTPEPEASDKFFSHLLRVAIATNAAQNLSGAGIVEDGSPAYSPSGAWIAFGRKGLSVGQWTPGRQLWLMRADGTEAHALTAEPLYNHSAFQWSADESQIVYMRFNAADPATPAEIWMINVADPLQGTDGSNARKLVAGGYLPQWLP